MIFLVLLIFYWGFEFFRYGNFPWADSYYRNVYQKAVNLEEADNYKDAYYTFSKVHPGYAAYDAVLFHQAQCAEALGDEKTVINKYKKIIQKFSKSPLEVQARYNLGRAYIRIEDTNAAKKQFKIIQKHFGSTDYSIASNYYLGQIYKKSNKNKAFNYWKKYIQLSPEGRFAFECVEEIISSKHPLEAQDRFHIGVVFYHSQKYNEATKYLKEAPVSLSWYYMAKCYQNLGDKKLALQYLSNGIKNYASNLPKDSISEALSLYVRLNPEPEQKCWDNLINMTQKYGVGIGDYPLYKKAQLLPQKQANVLYQKIVARYSSGDYASEALWNIFWQKYSERKYSEAIALGKSHLRHHPDKKATPKVLFWMGKLSERLSAKAAANSYYDKVCEQYPDSYYALRAYGRKQALRADKDPGWATDDIAYMSNNFKTPVMPYSYREISSKYGKLVSELLKVEDYDLLLSLEEKDPFIESWIKYKEGLRSKSIVIARDAMKEMKQKPDVKDKRWTLIYPLYYVDTVNSYAVANHISPVVVLSLMREESYFNNLAVSGSNARGLMQLLPGTAQDIGRWENLGSVDAFGLFNPETNVKFGSAYIKYVEDHLYNETVYAVAAYNGGPSAVKRWLDKANSDDIDEFVENIPYEQTRDYVKKVYGSYWNYKRIYKFQ